MGIPDLSFHQIRSLLHIHAALGTPRSSLPAGIPDIIAPPTSPLPGQSFVKIKAEFFGTSNRIKKLRGDVEAALIKWRYTKWKECYSHSGLEPTHILANDEMKVFVDKMFPSLDAVQAHPTLSTWPFLNLHGQDVLDRVSLYDRRHEEELIAAKEKRKAEKRKATEDKKAERERKKQKLQEDRNKEKEMWRNRMGEVIASKPGKIIGQSSRTPHSTCYYALALNHSCAVLSLDISVSSIALVVIDVVFSMITSLCTQITRTAILFYISLILGSK